MRGGEAAGPSEEGNRKRYHLLDGQQRAQAIALGFLDPFESQAEGRPDARNDGRILWLDLDPKDLLERETRSFLVRLTTRAHPWGYNCDDQANRLNQSDIRGFLEELKSDGLDIQGRPEPRQCWPFKANTPVPLAWLLDEKERHNEAEAFWKAVALRCEQAEYEWAKRAAKFLDQHKETPTDHMRAIWQGLNRVARAEVPYLLVPDDVLGLADADDAGADRAAPTQEKIDSVEHLFQRLNRGGTPLEGDELAYTMIKAYWPEVAEIVKSLEVKRMPAARLVVLAIRAALSCWPGRTTQSCIQGNMSVREVRRLAADEERNNERRWVQRFLGVKQDRGVSEGDGPGLAAVLKTIDDWLLWRSNGDFGLPPVIVTSIARSSPDVFLLLMWLAVKLGRDSNVDRRRIIALATSLHWLALDKKRAAEAVASVFRNALDRGRIDEAFHGILSRLKGERGEPLVAGPLPPRDFENLVTLDAGADTKAWRWLTAVKDLPSEQDRQWKWEFIKRVKEQKELLLFAQRAFICQRFHDYDPSCADMWEEHDRPWDFDHILASLHVNKLIKFNKYQKFCQQWLNTIGNLRAVPFEENRSDQDRRASKKINNGNLLDSFLLRDELQGFDFDREVIADESKALTFAKAAWARLRRIYEEWWTSLAVEALVSGSSEPEPSNQAPDRPQESQGATEGATRERI